METSTSTRTRWGRIRFAHGRLSAMAVAFPLGFALAIGVGGIALWTGVARGEHAPWLAGLMALCVAWSLVALVWLAVVDRATLRGAVASPEQSVEAAWMDVATAGAFRDVLVVSGIALATISMGGLQLDGRWALSGVIIVALLSTCARYLVAKTRG